MVILGSASSGQGANRGGPRAVTRNGMGMLETQPEAMAALMKEVPMGRLGRAEEIADAVLWLCSPASSFVIGHALPVDGGYPVRG